MNVPPPEISPGASLVIAVNMSILRDAALAKVTVATGSGGFFVRLNLNRMQFRVFSVRRG